MKIIGTVNALNRIDPDADTTAAADKLAAIVRQYKLVASSHAKKKGDAPEPDAATQTA